MFQDIVEANLLFDFYGQLLSERQKQVMELYYEDNLSLGEIAEEFNISRQGVYDALKTAQKSLEHYEEKLGRKKDFQRRKKIIEYIKRELERMKTLGDDAREIVFKAQYNQTEDKHENKNNEKMKSILERISEIEGNIENELDKLIE